MKKKEKGQYGYIDYYKKGKLLVTMILAIMIASIILSMLLAFGDTGRIGIIFAILLVLPFAKFLIAYIMCAHLRVYERKNKRSSANHIADILKIQESYC